MFSDIFTPLSRLTVVDTVRRMSVRKGSLLLVTLALLGAACSDASADTTTTATADTSLAPSTTAAAATTTTAPAATTSEPPTTTTPTTSEAPSDRIGDPALLEQMVAEALEEVRSVYEDDSIDVPVPDLTNADPLVALRELGDFDRLVNAQAPLRAWSPITTYPGSPARDLDVELADINYFGGLLRIRPEEPFEYLTMETVELSTLDLPEETMTGMPIDAVGVLYTSNSGLLVLVFKDTLEVDRVITEGWNDMTTLSIIAPTDAGWRIWDTISNFGGSA